MRKLIGLLMCLCLLGLTGCLTTGVSTFPVQIKSNSEILNSTGFIARVAAGYVKVKYPAEIQLFMDLSNQVLTAETDKILEASAQRFFDSLTNKITDPVAREAAKAYVNSFEIDIDTNQIIFDSGARQTAKDTIQMFKDVLEGE
jgi:hypothetical protein